MTESKLKTFQEGQQVFVIPPGSRAFVSNAPAIPATITKVNRTWLDIEETRTASIHRFPRTWRMRALEQHDGNMQYSQNRWRFVTPEQWAQQQRAREADGILRNAGLTAEFTSQFNSNEELRIKLADAVLTMLNLYGDKESWSAEKQQERDST